MVAGPQPTPTFVPNRDRAEVLAAKVTEYLLNLGHPEGAPKATFFALFGFTPSKPDAFIAALLVHVRDNPTCETAVVSFGTIYAIDAPLHRPDGRSPIVRSVWIIEPRIGIPRLVTAYPAPGRSAP